MEMTHVVSHTVAQMNYFVWVCIRGLQCWSNMYWKKVGFYFPQGGYFLLHCCNVNFLLWRHFASNSVLEFRVTFGSYIAMYVFSCRHKSHLFMPQEYGWALLLIDHFTSYVLFAFFNSHMYLLSSVLWAWFSCFFFFEPGGSIHYTLWVVITPSNVLHQSTSLHVALRSAWVFHTMLTYSYSLQMSSITSHWIALGRLPRYHF